MFVFDLSGLVELAIIIVVLLVCAIVYLIVVIKEWLIDKLIKRKMEQNREITIKILDAFEAVLIKNNIKIPNEDRKSIKDETCIYGTTYYDLEDTILEILNNKNN